MNTKQSQSGHKKMWIGIIAVVLLVVAISSANNPQKDSESKISDSAAQKAGEKEEVQKDEDKKPNIPTEYVSALNQADSYANVMHMSKQGVYDQLISEYGGQFSAKAAKYAIENVKSDWKANALAKAKEYQEQQHLSPKAIHDQLTSAYGEKFTKAEADYAIAHLND